MNVPINGAYPATRQLFLPLHSRRFTRLTRYTFLSVPLFLLVHLSIHGIRFPCFACSGPGRVVVSCLAGLSREALAAQRELVALRETLFQACRGVASRAAENEVGPGGDMASSVAESAAGPGGDTASFTSVKAAQKAVFTHLMSSQNGMSRQSTALLSSLAESITDNRRGMVQMLTREKLVSFLAVIETRAARDSMINTNCFS